MKFNKQDTMYYIDFKLSPKALSEIESSVSYFQHKYHITDDDLSYVLADVISKALHDNDRMKGNK